MARGFQEQLQNIVNEYVASGESWPATTREIAGWAIQRGLWKPQRSDLIDVFSDQLSRAMREDYVIDRQGRHVRSKHAARLRRNGEQLVLWADIRTASREHMEVAFQQRRQQIVGDCRQLKMDVDSYNENRVPDEPIQMVFDFTFDILESEIISTEAKSEIYANAH